MGRNISVSDLQFAASDIPPVSWCYTPSAYINQVIIFLSFFFFNFHLASSNWLCKESIKFLLPLAKIIQLALLEDIYLVFFSSK